ncbi:hypothetical protein LguiA_021282 [Lonicera macranthoides]
MEFVFLRFAYFFERVSNLLCNSSNIAYNTSKSLCTLLLSSKSSLSLKEL